MKNRLEMKAQLAGEVLETDDGDEEPPGLTEGGKMFSLQAETIRKANVGWRIVIFLPFNPYWQFVYSTFILVSLYFDMYGLLCLGHVDHMLFIYLMAWSVFLVDATLMTIHKMWGRIARAYHYPCKSWFFIALTWLTVIPVRFLHILIFNNFTLSIVEVSIVLFIHVLRCHRMLHFLNELSYFIGVNKKFITILAFNMILLISVNFFAIIWILIRLHASRSGRLIGWETYFYDRNDFGPEIQYATALAIVFQNYMKNVLADIDETYLPRKTFNVIIMLAGLVYRDLIVPSKLILFHIKSDSHELEYRTYIKLVRRQLINFGVRTSLRKKVFKYYTDFWKICMGLKEEEFLKTLPLCMQKNICLDLNWDPIQHSRILRYCGINYKREVSLRIKSIFLRPGDYIYKKGVLKKKLFYLVSGVVQLMSDLDGKSPLLSFSSGTVLGGVYTTLPCKSVSNIRCATYCEVRTIGMLDLYDAIRKYPWEVKPYRRRIIERVENAERMAVLQQGIEKGHINYYNFQVVKENRIKWLKKRWKTLASAKKRLEEGEDQELVVRSIPVSGGHTSRFLDLIVLSGAMELKQDRFCLKCRWPYVIDPASNFLEVWRLVTTVLIGIESLFLPYYVAFLPAIPDLFRKYLIFMTYLYIVDLYVLFATAVKTQHTTIVEPMAIVRHRLKSFHYILEIFSALPIGLSIWLFGTSDKFSGLMELLRLLKGWRVPKYLIFLESDLQKNILLIRSIRHFICLSTIIYFTACFLYLKACYGEECSVDSWVSGAKRQLWSFGNLEEISCFSSPFIYSLYFATSLCLRSHLTMVFVYAMSDVLVMIVITLIMINAVVYTYSQIAATFILETQLETDFSDLLKRADKFASKHSLSENTKNSLSSYLALQWEYNLGCDLHSKKPIFYDASVDLREDIYADIVGMLKAVPLFAGETLEMNNLVKKTAENARLHVLPRNVVLVYGGVKSPSLNIIRKGYCRMVSHYKLDIGRQSKGVYVGEGCCFPVPELLSNMPSVVTVTTDTECELVTVEAEHLVKSIRVNRAVNKHTATAVASFPKVKEMYQACIFGVRVTFPRTTCPSFYRRNFRSLPWDKRSFVSYFVFSYAIAPDGKFAFYWEIAKVLHAAISANYFILYFTLMIPLFSHYCIATGWVLDFLALCDVYVRCHVGYFNDYGLLILDPKLIVKNYLRRAFALDLIACLPIYLMVHTRTASDWAWLVVTSVKLLPMYRVINFLNFLKGEPRMNKYIVYFLTFTVCLATTMNVASNALAQYLCYFQYASVGSDHGIHVFDTVECNPGPLSGLDSGKDPRSILAASEYIVMSLFTMSPCSLLRTSNENEMLTVVIFSIIALTVNFTFRAGTCRLIFGGEREFSDYKEDVASFLRFVSKEATSALQLLSLDYCQYAWSQKEENAVRKLIERAHPTIRRAVLKEMYSRHLKMVVALSAGDISFFTALSTKVREHYASKGSVVLNKYDLNDKIYFITRGEVQVIVSKAFPRVSIGVGAAFGSFRECGKHRHLLKFVAKVRTHFLIIKTEEFYDLLQSFEMVKESFVREIQPHKEYLEGARKTHASHVQSYVFVDVKESKYKFSTLSNIYRVTDFLLSYVVPYATFAVVFTFLASPSHTTLAYIQHGLDVVYCLKIAGGLTVPFVDEETGLVVTDQKRIRRGYLRTWMFAFDVLSVLPVNLGWNNKPLLFLNRLLRGYTFSSFIYNRRNKVYVVVSSKQSDLIALLPLALYIFVCIWVALLPNGFPISRNSDGSYNFSGEGLESIIRAFVFLTGFVASTTAMDVVDYIIQHQMMGYLLWVHYWNTVLLAVTMALIMDVYHKRWTTMTTYESEVNKFKKFMNLRQLSSPLMETAWQYASLQWLKRKGLNVPRLLEDSPYAIKTRLMNTRYGYHLENNYLFKNAHPDMIRQLCAHLKPTHYYQEDYIVIAGDVDHRMYFVHSGEVEILVEDVDRQERLVGVLTLGDSFGQVQGLFNTQPHFFTYKARTEAEIMSLERADWRHIRAAFRHDTTIVYRRARKISFPYEKPVQFI